MVAKNWKWQIFWKTGAHSGWVVAGDRLEGGRS